MPHAESLPDDAVFFDAVRAEALSASCIAKELNVSL
jgi:hypothetical protein